MRADHHPTNVADLRVNASNDRPVDPKGAYVLYWMIAARRTRASFALDRALVHVRELGKPLLVFEPLRAGYKWASDRHHAYVSDDDCATYATTALKCASSVP